MAQGLGVLACSSGEKYKGHFDRNARHGRGACAYPSGARYFGMWYRGAHEVSVRCQCLFVRLYILQILGIFIRNDCCGLYTMLNQMTAPFH